MEYLSTEFIVMFTKGAIQWSVAIWILFLFWGLLGKISDFLFPGKLDADDIKDYIRFKREEELGEKL